MEKDLVLRKNEKEFMELKDYIDSTKENDGILMQILQKAQNIFGYLPIEVQKFISEEANIPMAEIYGVVSFYTQFSITPKGKHTIGVCMGTACYVRNAQLVVDRLAKELNVEVGDTTDDRLFTLEATRCLGCCGLAPVMMIDDEVYGKVEPDHIPEIIAKYKE